MRVIPRNADEQGAVKRALSRLSAEWGLEFRTVQSLIERWENFVKQVESGYQLSLHDYTVELELRDAIEGLNQQLPQRLAMEIEAALVPTDHRLRFATERSQRPLAPGVNLDAAWWWFATPRNAPQSFLMELDG